MSLLEVDGLRLTAGDTPLVPGLNFSLAPGSRTGLVGESGSGKSLTALAIMGLLPPGVHFEGSIRFEGRELTGMSERERARLRGRQISMVFQEPMTALNPLMKVGRQIAEVLAIHGVASRSAARARVLDTLERVGIADPPATCHRFPHQLSGGQRQRVMIAMAVICQPRLVIADEPTTALDTTVQKQVIDLLRQLVAEQGTSLLLISHDVPLVSSVCPSMIVLYGGRMVEMADTELILTSPRHPYTRGLLDAVPTASLAGAGGARLRTIPGSVPRAGEFPSGCVFRNRCERTDDVCGELPIIEGEGHRYACWHPLG